jgi:hypothetical protein
MAKQYEVYIQGKYYKTFETDDSTKFRGMTVPNLIISKWNQKILTMMSKVLLTQTKVKE